jgi:hypothetical protein
MRELRSKYNLPERWPDDDVAPNYAALAAVEAARPQLALPFAS